MYGGGFDRGGVQKYSPGVLVGNWYEDMRVREDKLKLYKTLKMYATENEKAATLNPLALENLTARLTEEVTLDGPSDGPVTFNRPLLVVSKKTDAALALDMSPFSSPGPNQSAVSAVETKRPQIRTTWVVQRCADTDNNAFRTLLREHEVLHYGQRVRLANEEADARGFLYLHSALESGMCASKRQPAVASYSASADNVFIVHRARERREDVLDGQPVMLGDPVVFIHSITNTPLCCDGTPVRTAYGMELGVHCGYNTEYHSRSLGAVATRDENIFYFSSGTEDDEFKLKSKATSDLRGVSSTMDGEEAEEIVGRIREGAIAFGGRVGFRAIARSLGVACNEHRLRYFNRAQLHAFISQLGVTLLPLELDVVMKLFDHTGNNVVCAQEFVSALRGNMNPDRMKAVVRAHQQLIIEGEGSVDFKDMLNLFRENAQMHPDVADGLITREEAIFDFENCWPGRLGCKLGTVTLNEFIEYYNDISPAVDDDERFIRMVYSCWVIPETAEYRKGEPFRVVTITHTNDTTETVKLPDSLVLDVTNTDAVKRLLVQHGIRDVASFTVSQRI